jgi:hypothetical protein
MQEATGGGTVSCVEILFDGQKDARQLTAELSAGICFAEECVENLCRLDGAHLLGSLCVLEMYLRYLDAVASELSKLAAEGGGAQ